LIILGYVPNSPGNIWDRFVVKVNAQGAFLWETNINILPNNSYQCLTESNDNGVAIIGGASNSFDLPNSFLLMKLDSFGNLFNNNLYGNAFQDFNLNCELDINEGGFFNQESVY